jgi:ribosome-binding protein aMBF1 (putative translation factor)
MHNRITSEAVTETEEVSASRRHKTQATTPEGQAHRHPTVMGQNINRLRKECGWSFEELSAKTGIDKKLILGHVNKGKGAFPETIKVYADAFSKGLNRIVTVSELEQ